jgi:hypothetical protein
MRRRMGSPSSTRELEESAGEDHFSSGTQCACIRSYFRMFAPASDRVANVAALLKGSEFRRSASDWQ